MSTGASLNRHGSEQTVGTPPSFVAACERRWGTVVVDLAADASNAKAPRFFTEQDNSLIQDWSQFDGVCWLNPPYKNIGEWAEKCLMEARKGARILMLVPASVGSNWYKNWAFYNAHSVYINGRIQFVGHTQPYPKDLMVLAYGFGIASTEIWTPEKHELK